MSERGVLTGLFRQQAAYLFPKMKDSLRTPLAIDPRDTNLHRCEANEFVCDAIVLEGLGLVSLPVLRTLLVECLGDELSICILRVGWVQWWRWVCLMIF